jgi:hypothetical protein
MKKESEIKDALLGLDANYKRNIELTINAGNYRVAGTELKTMLKLYKLTKTELLQVPSGFNFYHTLEKILEVLQQGKAPTERVVREYNAFSVQINMNRSD